VALVATIEAGSAVRSIAALLETRPGSLLHFQSTWVAKSAVSGGPVVLKPGERLICDGPAVERLIASMADELARTRRPDVPLRLVGVRTRGVPLANRLAAELARLSVADVPVGAVDITLYRDDLGRTQTWPVLRGTEIAFDIEGADVVLVDDVLFTGRTVRAAINAVCDLGRPATVRLAVLVDRGHRELPIRGDVVGLELKTKRDDRIRVRLRPADPDDEIVAIESGPATSPAPSTSPGDPPA
jgi:pyrimidine operon attenuation protein / uracil phosphoribosyltransferase